MLTAIIISSAAASATTLFIVAAIRRDDDHVQVDPERVQAADPGVAGSTPRPFRLRPVGRQVHSLQGGWPPIQERRYHSHSQPG